jgi:hypothetical protein
MALAIKADEHGGELVIGEDEIALIVMAVDDSPSGQDEGSVAKWQDTQGEQGSLDSSHIKDSHSPMCGLVPNIGMVEPRHKGHLRITVMPASLDKVSLKANIGIRLALIFVPVSLYYQQPISGADG